ncbi:NADPH-dependent FMN reductase [Pseudonocardia sp.]|uniref:NADPH-dependent FMN reductase n=1 Tax=Pseudonocardia sp. TaxID=60912 RepID=UPI0026144596|nr:NAD(P)H-dependent oxidoreductase [Pseudonocardia sp.]
MEPFRVLTVVGNPRAGSRTSAAADEVARQVVALLGWPEGAEPDSVELGTLGGELFDRSSARVAELVGRVSSASVVVVASPVFKATYTALLKAFLEWFDRTSLRGVVVAPVMVGAAAHHALAVETYLRPLLVELGGVLPTRGLYVLEDELDDLGPTVARWVAESGDAIRRTVLRGSSS